MLLIVVGRAVVVALHRLMKLGSLFGMKVELDWLSEWTRLVL